MKVEPLAYLKDEQASASSPGADIWLAASAGTGKTYVLAARVWRLLLRGVRPDAILCLTFTRAGAAEMAERVHARLAWWARLPDQALAKELRALDEPHEPTAIARARTLFAQVLESRGGGLRVVTIHAFCQTLLATFPLEAGLSPGFRAIEGREQAALAAQVLADLAARAEHERDARLTDALRTLSRRLGEDATRAFLLRAAGKLAALELLTDGIAAKVRRALDVPADFDADYISARCGDEGFDRQGLLELGQILADWGKTGERRATVIGDWLLGDADRRGRELHKLELVWNTTDGRPRGGKGQVPTHPDYDRAADRMRQWCAELRALQQRAALAADIADALHAARAYARAYADAKHVNGFVDFDDLIAKTVAMLTTPGMGSWIGYKIDQRIDHLLVDEAQDTNADQWQIVGALVTEFWAEHPDYEGRLRTLFAVGDTKQAIFGFQGTDPRHYINARGDFAEGAEHTGRRLVDLSLARSFRSTPPVLDVVDALIAELGPEALGITRAEPHVSARKGPGTVLLLPPVAADEPDPDGGEEGWVPTATRTLASRLAQQVAAWLTEPQPLRIKDRALRPGDVMILVRKRSDLAQLLVARLEAEGVAVAGVDRLRLAAPLAVKDCLAAVRFALQPDDDLNLAALLVSPIGGWSQDELYALAQPPRQGSLWRALRERGDAAPLALFGGLLRMADFVSPYVFLETMLSGDIAARRKLLGRLGNEAADSIDELINAALQFEREGVATLQRFIDWFDRGEGEIVRDPGAGADAVRVMTVHAAKGLQAPLVILADATGDPAAAQDRDFAWVLDEAIGPLPLFRPREAERALVAGLEAAALASAENAMREHWRLLYVAMTRAEEQLVVAGALGARHDVAPAASWHAAIGRAMTALEAVPVDDARWGGCLRYGSAQVYAAGARSVMAEATVDLPSWLNEPAPIEARPARPLAPSALGPDLTRDPPDVGLAAAAARGRLIHALFERLTDLAPDARRIAGRQWLDRQASDASEAGREAMLADVLGVLERPDYAALFARGGLAEVPIAGVVEGVVVSGTVDRLVVGDRFVDLIDFKTGRRVPIAPDAIPVQHLRQMAAYAAVLRGVFPDRTIRAVLLYTSGPALFLLDEAVLAAHKPGLEAAQQVLGASG